MTTNYKELIDRLIRLERVVTSEADALLSLIADLERAEAELKKMRKHDRINFDPLFKYASDNRVNYNQLCAVVREAIAAPVAQQGWLPIKSAPKDGTVFLGYRNGRIANASKVQRDDCEMWAFGNQSGDVSLWPDILPTHWMPLPKPPEA